MEDLTRTSLLLYRYKSIHLYRWHGQVSDPYVTYHPILRSETPHPKMSLVQDLYKHLQSTTLAGQLQGRVSFLLCVLALDTWDGLSKVVLPLR